MSETPKCRPGSHPGQHGTINKRGDCDDCGTLVTLAPGFTVCPACRRFKTVCRCRDALAREDACK